MRLLSLCVLCCLPLQSLWAQSLCPVPLRVGFDDWPPYHYYQQEGEHRQLRGFAIDYLNAVSARLGCRLHYVELPWKRGLHDLELGRLDILMEAYFSDDRARYAWFSIPYNPGRTALWVRKPDTGDEMDLGRWLDRGHRLGVTRDYYYGPDIAEQLRRYPDRVSAVNDVQNYRKLVLGRIDGFLGDSLATSWGLKKEGLSDKVVPHAMGIYETPTSFMLSKKTISSEFVQRFNQAIVTVGESGEHERIWRRYTSVR
ncbi:amino acid ABC transporter substrate-binding protein [Aeromonas taiwanensis]|uniref:Amino acid ABC transporter substrate-binding protein n=1 Tax=Aeromonas taiwanensis TaxID=633417 RepID=A0A5F0KBR1_9GAMM|nr:transporter substrate-binding domain-containing protein [Aeromonas taiwanensis]TFF76061.1 amino acid ABC transporter substrate-binding protein [Aeromonas taiwanensis]TFF77084.1 amino acid ABC transporter substrate-binding protein [Aeromonas taiwanensis]TFF80490.1 amino acid ABC transporter substrate-binding protein [Aeromonas taiwanensis]